MFFFCQTLVVKMLHEHQMFRLPESIHNHKCPSLHKHPRSQDVIKINLLIVLLYFYYCFCSYVLDCFFNRKKPVPNKRQRGKQHHIHS